MAQAAIGSPGFCHDRLLLSDFQAPSAEATKRFAGKEIRQRLSYEYHTLSTIKLQ
jgi:hypothetical protein